MKLGISSYSLYQAMQMDGMTILEAIDWIAGIGGEHVEIVPLGFDLKQTPELIGQIRERAAKAGIAVSNYAIGANFITDTEEAYESEIRRVMREVDIAHALGVKLMRHDVASRQDTSIIRFQEDLPRIAEACRRIADYAAQYGITTSLENHGYYVQASDRVQAVLHAVGRPNYKTTLDVGNFVCVDEQPVIAVKKNIAYASMVHVKDFYIRPADRNPGEGWFRSAGGGYLRGAIAGQGDLDLREILRIVKRSGYDGFLSIEYEGMEECRKGTKIAFENVRRIWEEV
ncbi:MAG: sugar phosphate isomerase/epimerase [Paenibacillus macerans]|uniref:TIM barrel protein n=2 Tax=Bacteria TaxID=2 RepID=A0A090ZLQ9_PAEMA|nr:sugar phosphate isomerase/epimerase [Paenibacillus macerans]KFN11547.1 xylose isomerase-like TIM barrel family protein [Paenibacillus macerans]MBS5911492.1 sugar phosphate isomerase/epimerase [Paenibacillus macerans]MCY7559193.1 sugar phosphate isomerase/epimerase [Paenibacillus macerans]MDU5946684.1 sugar phosphate isomerase/epimerase [Paenibacillus macerans]MDU7475489.1 sugar phosphate isomerase/epimerase [Paenibacillus macerans]